MSGDPHGDGGGGIVWGRGAHEGTIPLPHGGAARDAPSCDEGESTVLRAGGESCVPKGAAGESECFQSRTTILEE